MAEAILNQEEVKRIAIEYVLQKEENVGDVEITVSELSSETEPFVHLVKGIIRKHNMSSTFVDAIIKARLFELCISNNDGKAVIYRPDDWQDIPTNPQTEHIIVEPVEFIKDVRHKDKSDLFKELEKKYRFDGNKFKL